MTIVEFFDPADMDHLRAYKEVCDTGVWPKAFFAKVEAAGCTIPMHWAMSLAQKLADHYVEQALASANSGTSTVK